jgi:hypothetical protein
MSIKTFREVVDILDTAVGGPAAEVGPPHKAFWRDITRDQFVTKKILGRPLVVLGDGKHSNLVLALKGEPPFGDDPDADFPRMPVGFDPVSDDRISSIEQWIDDDCPDEAIADPGIAGTGSTSGRHRREG